MYDSDLHLEPNEASDLCPVFTPDVLRARGWDRAFVTVLDEASAEKAIAVVVHDAGAAHGEGWRAMRIATKPHGGAGRTEDAESCARRDGWVYLLGSQFGKKAGPLQPRRSWVARVSEESLGEALDGGSARLEIGRTRFGIHRAVNDALAAAAVDLLPLGARAREAYIDATIALGAAKDKRWAGRVSSGDHPINVEGMDFRADGRALIGLRYPVTAEGHPLLVELDDLDAVFADPGAVPGCSNVWVLGDVGDRDEPTGVRALHTRGGDRFDAIVGDLDAVGKGATVLEDHPQGGAARSRHVRFELPLVAGGGAVTTETVHDFGDLRRVEGVVVDDEGHRHYVLDEEGRVALRTLLLD
ncbi:MAG: hypothetical protein H0T43_01685 [Solirubrobacterales bacterium]|nr:hypothetical protein [Solirubrobacterales bacterium]